MTAETSLDEAPMNQDPAPNQDHDAVAPPTDRPHDTSQAETGLGSDGDDTETAAPTALTWAIEGFEPADPFSAGLVIASGDTHAWVDLAPMTVAALHDALGTIRAAQRAAVLGETPPAVADRATEPADVAPETRTTRQEAADPAADKSAADRRRARIILTALVAIVAASVVYGLAAGAVLI